MSQIEKIATYVCLGDSMSIDCYPYYELVESDPTVSPAVGAASLLYRNDSKVWPEFEHQDLVTSNPEMKICNLTEDGATTFDFLDEDYLNLLKGIETLPAIVTVTLCGNDMLRLLMQDSIDLATESANVLERFNKVIDKLIQTLPRAILILSTIYDPTDGTGVLPGFGNIKTKLKYLDFVNDGIRKTSSKNLSLLADVHKHFLGHGLSAPVGESWYWEDNLIEPGAKGANEIRRLWYGLLKTDGLV